MIYILPDGKTIDTAQDLNFEERNFVQKMFIYGRLDKDLDTFQSRWRGPGNPVWDGGGVLRKPTPAAKIILDMERKLRERT